ncbi:MAG: hypothetical protein DDT20_00844 [Firmicutes bacterium]|nr:hypothetical protein [Bacillota bacterium]
MNPKQKTRTYALWTYDVWGNARDGFNVNDRYLQGEVLIICKRKVFNANTPMEFTTYEPTDRQLSRVAGFAGVSWEGQEGDYTAELTRNGYPVGELIEIDRPEVKS